VSSLQPRLGHWLLRCPLCRSGFAAAAGALVCRNGHGFDLAREGYVNLLPGRRPRPAAGGDGALQLRHRAQFLGAGHLDALAMAIARQVGRPRHVLDAGSGTGHHLARIEAGLPGCVGGLGLDISKEAARLGAQRWPNLAFAVADIWGEWPVRDAAFDLVVSMFAPKNFAEMARVLRPGGWLALAYPGPEHLFPLRDRFALLHQHQESGRHYAEKAARLIGPLCVTRFRRRAVLDPDLVRAVILMGPNARHVDPASLDVGSQPLGVTFDINLLFARKPERKS
jgi:23S rRNA (guanine745-N1)-methyltransferase